MDSGIKERKPREECGVCGIWSNTFEVFPFIHLSLIALQHRGQEATGIATYDGTSVKLFKNIGLVSQVFTDQNLKKKLCGKIGIGHVKYSTTQSKQHTKNNIQPFVLGDNEQFSFVHNGHIRKFKLDIDIDDDTKSDSYYFANLLYQYIDKSTNEDELINNIIYVLGNVVGSFSIVFMYGNTLYAARDKYGNKPLHYGKKENSYIVASEICALQSCGYTHIKEIKPGELFICKNGNISSVIFDKATYKICAFEYIYLSRADNIIENKNVYEARYNMGKILASKSKKLNKQVDYVIPVPDSGIPSALGYANTSNISYQQAIVKNQYIKRTFINPDHKSRQQDIEMKLNPISCLLKGASIIVVDDSIVRGNTQKYLIKMLREQDVKYVHLRIASPPIKWPCFYGVDFPTREELIANQIDIVSLQKYLNADSLVYLDVDEMSEAIGINEKLLCKACFTGQYPIKF